MSRMSEQSRQQDYNREEDQGFGQSGQSGQSWNQGSQRNQGNQGSQGAQGNQGNQESNQGNTQRGNFSQQGYGGNAQQGRDSGQQGNQGREYRESNQGNYSNEQGTQGYGYSNQQGEFGSQNRSSRGADSLGYRQNSSQQGNIGQGYQGSGQGSQARQSSQYSSEQEPDRNQFGTDDQTRRFQRDWTAGPHAGKGPRSFKRNDQRIEEEVNERLTRHGHINAEDITASVKDGEVTLSGTVESRHCKRGAEEAIEEIFGVKEIHNQLRVKQQSDASSSESKQGDKGQQKSGQSGRA